ncbi:hypothetical protein D6146_03250 [Campylobacter jejuni]|nr:hypothetical protein [Campylobacter jejuni]EAH6837602.1 hypothetical protein [Campylobacter jejuni]EAJ6062808.1 hypothetical protein [Campylobacter jejuni]EAJ7720251.1 hypothetical protein [Campylobacter jejuni]EAK1582474.1 hypothetical protein [Campylobacter jejuni]
MKFFLSSKIALEALLLAFIAISKNLSRLSIIIRLSIRFFKIIQEDFVEFLISTKILIIFY